MTAATHEFSAHGLTGASVDRIARAARLNKAMLYYHFRGKDALYREIIRGAFSAIGTRLQGIAEREAPSAEKLAAFVDAFIAEAVQRPAFPRMVMRELSESGRHLNRTTAEAWVMAPRAFFRILREGVDAGVFRPAHPLAAFLSIIGPVVLTLASAPARERVGRLLTRPLPDIDAAALAAHVRLVASALLVPPPAAAPAVRPPGVRHARTAPSPVAVAPSAVAGRRRRPRMP